MPRYEENPINVFFAAVVVADVQARRYGLTLDDLLAKAFYIPPGENASLDWIGEVGFYKGHSPVLWVMRVRDYSLGHESWGNWVIPANARFGAGQKVHKVYHGQPLCGSGIAGRNNHTRNSRNPRPRFTGEAVTCDKCRKALAQEAE